MLPVSAIGTDANAALAVIDNRYDLSKSGLTAAEVRRVLLPELVMDEKGFLTYLDARIKAFRRSRPRARNRIVGLPMASPTWTANATDRGHAAKRRRS